MKPAIESGQLIWPSRGSWTIELVMQDPKFTVPWGTSLDVTFAPYTFSGVVNRVSNLGLRTGIMLIPKEGPRLATKPNKRVLNNPSAEAICTAMNFNVRGPIPQNVYHKYLLGNKSRATVLDEILPNWWVDNDSTVTTSTQTTDIQPVLLDVITPRSWSKIYIPGAECVRPFSKFNNHVVQKSINYITPTTVWSEVFYA